MPAVAKKSVSTVATPVAGGKSAKAAPAKAPPTKPAMTPAPKSKPAPAKENCEAATSKVTVRHKIFTMLKESGGMTGRAIADKLGIKGVPDLLKDEGVCEVPRIKRVTKEEVRGVVYMLTAAGSKALDKGTVDSDAAAISSFVKWPEGK